MILKQIACANNKLTSSPMSDKEGIYGNTQRGSIQSTTFNHWPAMCTLLHAGIYIQHQEGSFYHHSPESQTTKTSSQRKEKHTSKHKMAYHTRSNSLPSSSHPVNVSIEDHISRIQSCAAASSSSSICQNLSTVKDLYEQINDLIRLPLNQQILCNESYAQGVNGILEGSLTLLDVCETTKDIVSQMKELILDLESALRRKSGVDFYKVSRKKIIKQASKCLGNLNKLNNMTGLEKDSSLVSVVRMVKEVESISLSALKSIIVFVSGSKVKSESHGWSMVTKMMKKSNRVTCESEINEMEKIDQAIDAKSVDKDLQRQLESLESIISEMEDGLDSVSKCLVKMRVSLLNVFTN